MAGGLSSNSVLVGARLCNKMHTLNCKNVGDRESNTASPSGSMFRRLRGRNFPTVTCFLAK